MKDLCRGLFLIFVLILLASCSGEAGSLANNAPTPILRIDNKEISAQDAFIYDKGAYFISVNLLREQFPDFSFQEDAGKLFCKIRLQDYFEIPTETLFYHKELGLHLPLVEYKSERYLNVKFLKELFGFKLIEQDTCLSIFSEGAEESPDTKALLPQGARIYQKEGEEFRLLKRSEKLCEVYVRMAEPPRFSETLNENERSRSSESHSRHEGSSFLQNRNGREGSPSSNRPGERETSSAPKKLPAILPSVGLCYVETHALLDLSPFESEKKRLRPREKTEKYKALHLTWDVLSSYRESVVKAPTEKVEGLDVLIPTSFRYVGDAFCCELSHEYVDGARRQAYELYGHFSNYGDAEFFRKILADENEKQELIDALLFYASYFELDGINLDLSGLEASDRDAFSSFFIALSERSRALGLRLSLCVPPIESEGVERKIFNKYLEYAPLQNAPFFELSEASRQAFLYGFIDFPLLKERADYFILMCLDQYASDSEVAGPVASLTWVEENLKTLLAELPSDRLVLAQPSYLRIFTLDAQGENVLSSKISSHEELQAAIRSRTLKYLYDASSRQELIEFRDLEKPVIYRVWIEDEASLLERLATIERFRLRGYASWSLAFEEAWQSRLKSEVLGALR